MSLLEKSVFLTPVFRVNNRQLNIEFYQKNLGFKLVYEENAIAIFTSFGSGNERFVIEESPSVRTRAVEGTKKVNTIVIKTSDARAIEQLLAHGAEADALFIGPNGYAFETLSPEGDRFLLHAEDDISKLEVTDLPELVAEDDFKGLADFSFETIVLNVLNEEVSRSFYQDTFQGQFPVEMDFIEAEGPDLAIEPHLAWDLEILEVKVPEDYDLAAFKAYLEEKGLSVYLDAKEKVLVLSDPSLIEIWFMK
ncbi:peptidase [Streptococcus penaeicida]|uniref:Peptidase n=1 Tax=Streptococcus penaeicida TaxID=1765960 RepID=A0A2N8LEH3_9STRE|nr:CppA N-terminal domain-containing protein [Streptococcus penaeicida]PND48535.1 peptidase [Streptococcus penaeicida]